MANPVGDLPSLVLEHLPCGVSVFDGELRLILWNTRFRTMLGFPAALFEKPDVGFEDFVRFNAQRGDYAAAEDQEAHVRRILAEARQPQPKRWQRTMPDGTRLAVCRGPLPAGGFATIYIDITATQPGAAS